MDELYFADTAAFSCDDFVYVLLTLFAWFVFAGFGFAILKHIQNLLPRMDPELFVQVLHVRLHGVLRNIQHLGYSGHGAALLYLVQNLAFAVGQIIT